MLLLLLLLLLLFSVAESEASQTVKGEHSQEAGTRRSEMKEEAATAAGAEQLRG